MCVTTQVTKINSKRVKSYATPYIQYSNDSLTLGKIHESNQFPEPVGIQTQLALIPIYNTLKFKTRGAVNKERKE